MPLSIHVTRCPDYEISVVRKQISEHLDLYPQFGKLNEKMVLVKVNLLSATDPERAVTTHPVIVNALVLEILKRGLKVIIGDSPGGLFSKATLAKAYMETGLEKVAEETGATLNFYVSSHEERHPKGKFTKKFNISNYIRSADLIIAVPKIKTHMFCGLTCASKIMFGAVPGTEKVKYHTRFPDTVDFSRMLLDLTDLCGVDLFIVDGIIRMDGKGPARGNPRKVGIIISGTEHAAIDLQICKITGLDPEKIPVMIAVKEQGYLYEEPEVTVDGKDHVVSPLFKPVRGGWIVTRPPISLRRFVVNLSTNKPRVSILRRMRGLHG